MKIRPLPYITSLLAAGLIPYFGNRAAAQVPEFSLVNQSSFGITDLWERHDPALGDLDGDGDLDLVLGTVYGVRFFENTGSANSPAFVWDGDENAPLNIGFATTEESIAVDLVDIDNDGDLDLFSGDDSGFISFFENTGTPTAPSFARDADPMPFGIYQMAYYTSPSFVDWDADGDMDLVVGELNGSFYFYENIGTPTAPDFISAGNNLFGLAVQNIFDSKIDFADIDGDGDMDAVVGTYFGYTYAFLNTGTPTVPAFESSSSPEFQSFFNSRFSSSPEFADIDGDGDADLFVGGSGYTDFHENIGTPSLPNFEKVDGENTLQLAALGTFNSSITAFDVNGDGLLDAGISSDDYYQFTFFSNVGSSNDPSFAFDSLPSGISYDYFYEQNTVEFFDADGDGDLDLISSSLQGTDQVIVAAENIGNVQNPSFAFNAPQFASGITSPGNLIRPTAVDIDGDGDTDLFFGVNDGGSLGYANLVFFENTGTPTAPAFERQVTNFPFGLLSGQSVYEASSAFGDFDLDGDFDAMIGVDGGTVFFAENTGTPTAPAFAPVVDAAVFGVPPFDDKNLTLEAVDLDGDGDLDLLVGGYLGRVNFLRNDAIVTGPLESNDLWMIQ